MPKDPVSRHVGADIEIGSERRQMGIAGLTHPEQGARLRIEGAEAQEVAGIGGGQDRQMPWR